MTATPNKKQQARSSLLYSRWRAADTSNVGSPNEARASKQEKEEGGNGDDVDQYHQHHKCEAHWCYCALPTALLPTLDVEAQAADDQTFR